MKPKLIRITTIPIALEKLLTGQLTFMSSFYDVTAIASEKENLEQFGKVNKVNTFYVEMTRKITPVKDLMAIVKLYFYLKKEKPFIVHTHTPKAGMVGMIASRLAGVPHRFHTVAGLPLMETQGFKRKILDLVEKVTYACATKVYPNSFGLQKIIKENKYTHESKLKVIGNGSSNGIDTSFFNPELFSDNDRNTLKESLNITQEDYVFVFVGRLVKDKGINELIHAFNQLSKEAKKVKLLLVGYFENDLDPLEKSTLYIVENNSHVVLVGYQSDVRPYFSISNALVFPSYREGFPNVVMQAGAMNLPCIVSDINGCNEIITDNHNGFVIPVKDEEAILQAMRKMLIHSFSSSKPSFFRNLIASQYEQKVIWAALLNEYRDMG